MKELRGACIIGQSGGPTSVINASAYGVIDTALKSGAITQVLGAEHGIKGVLADRLFDMGQEDPEELRLLKYTPSSALGSCRYKIADPELDDTDYKRILEVFKKHDVRYFFYNGGNDSMDTCNKINQYMQSVGYDCRVMGVPKTIDNDLFGTDHCPGYASAAKYIATSIMEVYQDAHVYDTGMIVVVEIMGRHAGWLTAASALAGEYGAGPDLIYLPETDFSMPDFIEDVKRIYQEKGNCIVAVSEGIHYENGDFVSEAKVAANDGFGHAQLGGLAAILSQVLKEETGAKVRGIELNLLQRCAAHLASETDIEESYMAGKVAVENAGRAEPAAAGLPAPLRQAEKGAGQVNRALYSNGWKVEILSSRCFHHGCSGMEMPLLSLESMAWTCGVYAAAETMLLAILLIDDTQALHHQILIVGDVVAAVARDHRCVGTGGYDGRLLPVQHIADAVDDAVQHAGSAVDNAAAHTVLRVFSDKVARMLEGNIG